MILLLTPVLLSCLVHFISLYNDVDTKSLGEKLAMILSFFNVSKSVVKFADMKITDILVF